MRNALRNEQRKNEKEEKKASVPPTTPRPRTQTQTHANEPKDMSTKWFMTVADRSLSSRTQKSSEEGNEELKRKICKSTAVGAITRTRHTHTHTARSANGTRESEGLP